MKMKRILAFIAASLLLIFIFYGYTEFNGNPFTKITAKNKVNEYLITNFTALKYEKSAVNFNFKDDTYYIKMDVANTEDGDFTISYRNGEIYDDYEYNVLQRANTESRLQIYLNEERWDAMVLSHFGGNYHFSLLTPERAYWESHLPELDTPLDELTQAYPLELSIYLHDIAKYDVAKLAEIKKQIYADYQKENIHVSNISIK